MRARTICGEMRSRRARILTAGNAGLAGVHTMVHGPHRGHAPVLAVLCWGSWRETGARRGDIWFLLKRLDLTRDSRLIGCLLLIVCNKLTYS